MSLAFLPDLKTESKEVSGLPNFYNHKPDTAAKAIGLYAARLSDTLAEPVGT